MKHYDQYKEFKINLILKYKRNLSRSILEKKIDSFVSINDFLAVEMSRGPDESTGNINYNYQSSINVFYFFTILVKHFNFNKILCIPNFVIKWKEYIDKTGIVFYHDSGELIIPAELKNKIKECMNSDIRFIYFTLMLVQKKTNEGISHANIIVIDLFKNTVERFEPYGSITEDMDESTNDAIENRLLKILELKKFNYIRPLDISPKLGPQKKADAYGGMCVTFSMLYLQLRLMNPDIDQKELVNYLLKKKKKDLINLILRYAKFIELTLKAHSYQIFKVNDHIKYEWFTKQQYIISKKKGKYIWIK